MPDLILTDVDVLRLANGVEGILTIGGNITRQGIPQMFHASEFEATSNLILDGVAQAMFKSSGSSFQDSSAASRRTFHKSQPFWMNLQVNDIRNLRQGTLHGVIDSLGRGYAINCYSNPNQNWFYNFYAGDIEGNVVTGVPIGFRNNMALYSDGINFYVQRQAGGGWTTILTHPIPENAGYLRWVYNLERIDTYVRYVQQRLDTITSPFTTDNITITSAPSNAFAIRIIDSFRFGIRPLLGVGNFSLELSHPEISIPTTIGVIVDELYLRPSDRLCGGFVIEGDIIQFQTNGGGGLLEATGGTVLNNLQWQAPFIFEEPPIDPPIPPLIIETLIDADTAPLIDRDLDLLKG